MFRKIGVTEESLKYHLDKLRLNKNYLTSIMLLNQLMSVVFGLNILLYSLCLEKEFAHQKNGSGMSHRICRVPVPVQTEPTVVVTAHKKGAIALPCLKLLKYILKGLVK